jgi:hypothetical protein
MENMENVVDVEIGIIDDVFVGELIIIVVI